MSKFLSLAAALSVTILPSGCATEGDNSGMQLFQQVVGIASMAVGTYTKNDNLTNQGQNLFQQSLNTTPTPAAAPVAAPAGMNTASVSPTQAVFRIKSNHPNTINIAYYSQTRKGWVWPAADKHWVIANSEWTTHTLNCNVGEQVCYGAWVEGRTSTYWGSGFKGAQGCANCCITCGASLSRELNP
jgi:hypothetical protein